MNECDLATNNCHHNATCTNPGGYSTCICNSGFDVNGIDCKGINECDLRTDDCHDASTCVNHSGFYTCLCNNGYAGDGLHCEDEDECVLGTDNCHDDTTCVNSIGSFACTNCKFLSYYFRHISSLTKNCIVFIFIFGIN